MVDAKQNQFVRSRTHAEVNASLFSIQRELRQLSDTQTCVLHCMQPRRPDFYKQIEREFAVHVHTDHQRAGLGAAIRRAALGLSALIVLGRYEDIPALFSRVSEQAMAALYVVANSTLEVLPELAQRPASEIAAEIRRDPTHLLYQVDEDSAAADGQMVEVVSAGPSCPQSLKDAVDMSTSAP